MYPFVISPWHSTSHSTARVLAIFARKKRRSFEKRRVLRRSTKEVRLRLCPAPGLLRLCATTAVGSHKCSLCVSCWRQRHISRPRIPTSWVSSIDRRINLVGLPPLTASSLFIRGVDTRRIKDLFSPFFFPILMAERI